MDIVSLGWIGVIFFLWIPSPVSAGRFIPVTRTNKTSDGPESRLAVLRRIKDVLKRRLLNPENISTEDSLEGLEESLGRLGIKIPQELKDEELPDEGSLVPGFPVEIDPGVAQVPRHSRHHGPLLEGPPHLEGEDDQLQDLLMKIRQDSNLKHKKKMIREHGLHPQERLDKQWKEFRRWRRKRKRRRKLRRRVLGDVLKELGLGRKNENSDLIETLNTE